MPSRTLSRRDLVVGCLTVAGFSGCSTSSSRQAQLGAESVTARSIPAGSDRLAVFDIGQDNRAASSVSDAILTRRQFNSIPDPVATLPAATTGPLAETDVGKLACLSANANDGSAAVIWARWTDENLATALGSNATQNSATADSDRVRFRTSTASAARLTDTAFAVGDHETVRSIVDVWHHDGAVVSEDTLAPFERTDRGALIRFAAQDTFDRDGSIPEPYDRIENGSMALESVDTGTNLAFHFQVGSIDDAPTVESALRDDLVDSSRLPSPISLQLQIDRSADVIEVSYEAAEATMADSGPDVFTAAMDSIEGA